MGGQGKTYKDKREEGFIIMFNNVRGFKSKQESVKNVADSIKADVIILNETHVSDKSKVSIPGYYTFSKGRATRKGGGISTSVANNLKQYAVNIKEGENEDEYQITRLENTTRPLNIVNCYG